MWADQEICERFSNDESAFSEIVKKYEKLVFLIIKEVLEKGKSDIHLKMLSGYKNIIDDIRNEVWLDLTVKMRKGIVFNNEHSLINLIRVIAIRKTKNVKNISIKNRNPSAINKNNMKDNGLKTASNVFESMDHKKSTNEFELLAIDGIAKMYLQDELEADFDVIYKEISKKMSTRQQELCGLIKSSLAENNKLTQSLLAEKLGVTDRTVRNDLDEIHKLYKSMDLSLL